MQYVVEIYFTGDNEHIGDAVFGDSKTMQIYEKENLGYDIIFRNNYVNSNQGKTLRAFIIEEQNVDEERDNGQYVVKRIFINEFNYLDPETGNWETRRDKNA
jgi:hypothetical protein